MAVALDHWADLDGWAVSKNLPHLPTLPLSRFANLVWFWVMSHSEDEKAANKFKTQLWRPPPGVVPEKGPWSAEAETSAFKSLKQALGK